MRFTRSIMGLGLTLKSRIVNNLNSFIDEI